MKGKKGYAYITAASLIIVIMLSVFLVNYNRQDESEVFSSRIKSTNDFVKGFNKDIARATEISAIRTLLALEDNAAISGQYYTNLTASFEETFINGTVGGLNTSLMENASFKEYLVRINQIGGNIGLTTNITVIVIYLGHTNPWTINVLLEMTVNISDTARIANWIYTKNFSANVPITNLRDPVYSVGTGNKIPNTIRMFNESPLVTEDNVTINLEKMINDSYYIESPDAPNFLMRFENKTGPDPYGIESIVNIQLLSDQDIEVYPDRIKVDYIYFNDLSGSALCDVQNVSVDLYLVLPQNRDILYQIENLTYSTSCP